MQSEESHFKSVALLPRFTLSIAAFVYPAFTCVSLALMIWSFYQFIHVSTIGVLLLIVSVGIAYDNLILTVSCWQAESLQLEFLHRIRCFIHHLFVPLLVVAVVEVAQQADLAWLNGAIATYSGWGIALGMISLGLTSSNCFDSELNIVRFAGALYYIPQNFSPLPAILTTAFVGGVGASLWVQLQCPWILIGALLVFVGNAIPTRVGGKFMSATAELGLMAALLMTVGTSF